MTETIQVGYTHFFVEGISVYHKYILYTDGTGKQFYARGGPVWSDTLFVHIINTESGEYIRDTPDWDYGRDTGADNPNPDAIPHHRETIINGDDLSAQWTSIQGFMQDIEDRVIPYAPRHQQIQRYSGRSSA